MSKNVGARELVEAWGKILAGYRPNLSIEITRECPLRCPGCYAYNDEHLGGDITLRQVRELNVILPELARRGVYTQLVTSAVRPIPIEWSRLHRLQVVVSIDGLQPEH